MDNGYVVIRNSAGWYFHNLMQWKQILYISRDLIIIRRRSTPTHCMRDAYLGTPYPSY